MSLLISRVKLYKILHPTMKFYALPQPAYDRFLAAIATQAEVSRSLVIEIQIEGVHVVCSSVYYTVGMEN